MANEISIFMCGTHRKKFLNSRRVSIGFHPSIRPDGVDTADDGVSKMQNKANSYGRISHANNLL